MASRCPPFSIVTLRVVDIFWPPKVADTLATPPICPDGVKRPEVGPMDPTSPRSIANDAGTAAPLMLAVNVTVGVLAP